MSEEDVLAANEAFYRAFNQKDAEAMDDVWARSQPVSCTPPPGLEPPQRPRPRDGELARHPHEPEPAQDHDRRLYRALLRRRSGCPVSRARRRRTTRRDEHLRPRRWGVETVGSITSPGPSLTAPTDASDDARGPRRFRGLAVQPVVPGGVHHPARGELAVARLDVEADSVAAERARHRGRSPRPLNGSSTVSPLNEKSLMRRRGSSSGKG